MELIIFPLVALIIFGLTLFIHAYNYGGVITRRFPKGKAPWKNSREGRTIMMLAVSLIITILLIISIRIFGEYPGLDFLRVAIYSFLAITVWNLTITMLRIQSEKADNFFNKLFFWEKE